MSGDPVELVLSETRDRMTKAVAHARGEFASVRTGRADPHLVEKIVVDYHGAEIPIQQLANTSAPEARMLVINPYDKSSMHTIEQGIRNSDLGLNPSNDGAVIRLSFPPLTAERRKELVKLVRSMAEDGRVALRNLRRSARQDLESFEKEGELSEDELDRAERELDRTIHAEEARIDEALATKEQELLED